MQTRGQSPTPNLGLGKSLLAMLSQREVCGKSSRMEETRTMDEKKPINEKDEGIKMVFQSRGTISKEKPCFCACHDSYEMGSKKASLK